MNDTSESSQGEQSKSLKLNLNDLLPAKVSVETSIGTLYVRHANTTDWKVFKIDDTQKLGRVVVGVLCSRLEDKCDRAPLAEEDLDALTKADFLALVPVISRQSGWREIPAGGGLKALGNVVKEAKEQENERHKKMLADMSKSIGSSYGFLGKSTVEKLQEQMAGLVDFRSAQSGTKVMRGFESQRTIDTLKIPMPLRPEDSPLGRATLESAENSREVAQKMDALVNDVAGLNQTLIQHVLPEWFKKIEEDQKGQRMHLTRQPTGCA